MALHHILLAHASATRLYRKKYQGKQHGCVGISIYTFGVVPLTNSTKDVTATERANDFLLGWVAHPLMFGDYPEIMKKNVGSRLPVFTDRESKQVKGSVDFLGLIHYSTVHIKDNSPSLKQDVRDFIADMAIQLVYTLSDNTSAYEFPIQPWGLRGVLEYFKQVYGNPPIYIHENGQRSLHNSTLEDMSRVKYIHEYIGGVLEAVRNGSNTRGYFTWAFLDVFKLLDGYGSSFGLYYVDWDDPDFKRDPKLSAYWYSYFLKGNIINSDYVFNLKNNFSTLCHVHCFQ